MAANNMRKEVARAAARGYGGARGSAAAVVAFQDDHGIARLVTTDDCSSSIGPPPGLAHPNEATVAIPTKLLDQHISALPPGLPLLHDADNSKGTTSLAEVASYMSKKDAQVLSAAIAQVPLPGPSTPNEGKSSMSFADVASYMSSKDAQALSAAIGPPPGLPPPNEDAVKSAKTWPLQKHAAPTLNKNRSLSMAVAPAANAKKTPGMSLEELIQQSAEKYDLNMEFWGRYSDVSAMTLAKEREEILEIVENFALIHRKHGQLFQKLKSTVLRSMDGWSAPELAALCHAWAKLGFKHEDMCVAMADRVAATINLCTAQELCWIWDAYASVRVTIPCVTEAVTLETYKKVDDFTVEQLCNHASSYARLNLPIAPLFKKIGDRLVQVINAELKSQELGAMLNARALSLAAYSFAKLGFFQRDVFEAVAAGALPVARNFTAKDLQMIMVAFAKAQHCNSDLVQELSAQASRRVAQFSAESLALTLKSLATFQHQDDALLNRVVEQLPRLSPTFRPIDIVTTLNAFAALQFHNPSLFDILTPAIVEQAPVLTQSDWVGALQGYSSPGRRDEEFLTALSIHLKTKRLTLQQLAAIMSGCASLSFNQVTESLAEATIMKVEREGVQIPANVAAQMYSALALLGCTHTASPKVEAFMSGLASRLSCEGAVNELSVRSCLDLCYASLVADPKRVLKHPIEVSDMLEHLESQAESFSLEEQLLLGQMQRALHLLPWNGDALFPLRLEEFADDVEPASGHGDVPLAYFSSVLGPLAPHASPITPGWMDGASDWTSRAHNFVGGVHAAVEVRDGLEDISATLRMHDVQHEVVTDNLLTGAFIESNFGSGEATRFVWGSSVHYVEDLHRGQQYLKPAAQFQVAALQAEANMIVIPHWSWPMKGDSESKARCLLNLVKQHCK